MSSVYVIIYYFLVCMYLLVVESFYYLGVGINSRKRVNYSNQEVSRSLAHQRIIDRVNSNCTKYETPSLPLPDHQGLPQDQVRVAAGVHLRRI
jgi:hypothetical protein